MRVGYAVVFIFQTLTRNLYASRQQPDIDGMDSAKEAIVNIRCHSTLSFSRP